MKKQRARTRPAALLGHVGLRAKGHSVGKYALQKKSPLPNLNAPLSEGRPSSDHDAGNSPECLGRPRGWHWQAGLLGSLPAPGGEQDRPQELDPGRPDNSRIWSPARSWGPLHDRDPLARAEMAPTRSATMDADSLSISTSSGPRAGAETGNAPSYVANSQVSPVTGPTA